MAEAADLSLLIQCDICFLPEVNNKVLKCQHHFCSECVDKLDKWIENGVVGVQCPMCREFSPIDFIKSNPYIKEVKEVLGRIKLSREPTVDVPENIDVCQSHNLKLNYYCKTCRLAICSECGMKQHKKHNSEEVYTVAQEITEEAESYLKNIKGKKEKLTESISSSSQLVAEIKTRKEEVIDKIKEHSKQLQEVIIKSERSFIAELENKVEKSLKTITDCITIQDEQLTNLQTLETTSNDISQNKTSFEIIESFHNGLLDLIKQSVDDPRIKKNNKIDITFEEYNILKENLVIGKLSFRENTQLNMKEETKLTTFEDINDLDETLIKDQKNEPTVEVDKLNSDIVLDEPKTTRDKTEAFKQPDIRPKTTTQTQHRTDIRPSFRFINIKLQTLSHSTLEFVNQFPLNHKGNRLCLFNNTFWIPHFDNNFIGQYNLTGEFLETVKHQQIIKPRALHPLHDDHLIVAAKSGLFKINTTGNGIIGHKISDGYFYDIYIHLHITALEIHTGGNRIVHVYSTDDSHQLLSKLTLESNLCERILQVDNYILGAFSDDSGNTSHISKYSLSGARIEQIGKPGSLHPGEFKWPRLCLYDNDNTVLITDPGNNRLQIYNKHGKWSVVRLPGFTSDMWPMDVVINNRSVMCVVYWDDTLEKYCIKCFKIRL